MSWLSEATIKALAFPLYGVTLLMLIGVEALGFVSKGAQRWLDLGPIRLQPSEFMKPAIVLTLARFYELVPAGDIRKWRAIWPALRAARRPGVPDPRPARPRHLHHGRAVRRDGDVPRRACRGGCSPAPRRRSRWRRRSPTACSTAISASASTCSSIPESDPARRRLPHRPVEDRDRLGRDLGQGLPPRQPEPSRLSARRPHRLRVRDHGRGMGPGRRGPADLRVRSGDPLGNAGQRQRPDAASPSSPPPACRRRSSSTSRST